MRTTTINIKTDEKVKTQAKKIAGELGLNLSAVLNALLRQFVRTRAVQVSLEKEETPSPFLLEILREAEKDIRAGRVSPQFESAEKALAWLRKK